MKERSQASGLRTVDSVVWEFLGFNQYGDERYEDYLGFALSFYSQKLNVNGYIGVKTETIELSRWKTFKLPPDCIDWIAIGMQSGVRLRKFVGDDTLTWNHKDLYDAGLLDVVIKDDQDSMNLYTVELDAQGNDIGRNFHVGEKHDVEAYFTENKDTREITIHPVSKTITHVVLRYISDAYNKQEKSTIPATAVEAMQAWMDWKEHEYSPSKEKRREAERKRQLYLLAWDEFLAMETDWNKEDMLEILYDSFSLTPNL